MAFAKGLLGLLQRRTQPAIKCFTEPAEQLADEDARALLVDGGAVLEAVTVSSVADSGENAAQLTYLHTCRLLAGLRRTQMRLLVVLSSEFAAALAAGDAALAGGDADAGGAAHELAFHQGLLDMGAELHWAAGSQHALILELYRKNKAQVCGVLTNDACYFVYGVEKFGFVKDVLVDRISTTLNLWECEDCWKNWRLAVGGRMGGLSPLERAQVAALLGAQAPKDAVEALGEDLAGASLSAKRSRGADILCSPSLAAAMALSFDASEELPIKFFQECLGLTRFADNDLQAFRASVGGLFAMTNLTKSSSGKPCAAAAPAVSADVRGTLLQGAPAPSVGDLLEPTESSPLYTEEHAGEANSGVLVEVGSSLSASEWNEMDDKDIISKTRHGAGFRIMQKIPVFDPQPKMPTLPSARIDEECVWQYLYAKRKTEKVWKRVAEATFAVRWAAAHDKESMDKKTASELKKLTEESVMAKVDSLRDSALAKRTKQWLQYLPGKDVDDMLALRREAILQGPDSVAWRAAEACWNQAKARDKAAVLKAMFTCDNKAAAAGPPARYPHQEEMLREIHQHILREESSKIDHSLPLQIELSTPTGSGKTFAALMLHLQLLKAHHSDAILVYSVPTKSVLKTVGQAFEAHGAVYWTAASVGDQFQIRRPYSIRTKRGGGNAGTSSMADQLAVNMKEGKENSDRGNGRVDVIIADIVATAGLMKTAHKIEPTSPFHASNIVLYFDEPNMGVHLNPKVKDTVAAILKYAPFTTVLASATLPPWSALDPWWRVGGQPASRAMITLEPYELPQAHLETLDELRQELRQVNLLSLFESHEQFCEVLRDNKRLQIILLRHLRPEQGLDLLGAETDMEHTGFGLVHGEVATLREALEQNFASLMHNKDLWEELRARWSKSDTTKGIDSSGRGPIAGVISKSGITMIATPNARTLALELAGKTNEQLWAERMHRLNSEKTTAARMHKEAEKEKARRKNDDGRDDAGGITGWIRLRDGIQVSLADADSADQDELLMLGAGIAYNTASGASPLVQRMYQQTLLSVPEKVMTQSKKLPPINVLVVDYSSIYGTDCPAVDTLVMTNELGKALTWQDHQQFLGRLRRDGRAIFTNLDTLRRATIGVGELGTGGPEPGSPRDCAVLLLAASKAGTAPAAVLPKLEAARAEGGLGKPALAANLLVAAFGALLGAPPGARGPEKRAYAGAPSGLPAGAAEAAKAMAGAVGSWGPLVRHLARSDEDHVKLIAALQAMAEGKSDWGEAGRAYMDLSPRLLKLLYDEDVVSEEAVLAWDKQTRATTGDSRFLKLAGPFIKWLEEAEEDSGEESEEE
eukprot:jgi/Tetstr1/427872/TSEL_017949.t1